MEELKAGRTYIGAFLLAAGIFGGLALLGHDLASAAIKFRELDRTVTVKGLSVREFPADVVIWPIQFSVAGNDLAELYRLMEVNAALINQFLTAKGIDERAISLSAPAIVDKSAQQYGGGTPAPFRYTATQTVTVYSPAIERVRSVKAALSELGKKGIVFNASNYEHQTEYLFTRLNDVKPEMIEEATRHARSAATKFAQDSASRLGKIKSATQGQFSISHRDKNNPHIKRIRVVSTIQYYLVD
ncbi:MAG: SIMPL domain-containing protein [Gammaproteobacteria bacterium]